MLIIFQKIGLIALGSPSAVRGPSVAFNPVAAAGA
jgi:hypothetical protein